MCKLNCDYIFSDYLSRSAFIYLGIALLIIFMFFYSVYFMKTTLGKIGLVLVVVGAGVNMISRFNDGCVSDCFNFFNLFSFNIWDLFVTIGAILILRDIWIKE